MPMVVTGLGLLFTIVILEVTRNDITRTLLFDAGGSPEGLTHNLDCLELNPTDWNCIVLSHGHADHVAGLVGLHQRLGRLSFPLTLHPETPTSNAAWLLPMATSAELLLHPGRAS